jgi:hypothetical protein
MANSFESWNSINETTRSKQVLISGGKRYKVVIKIQSSAKFMVKTVNEANLIDSSGKLTSNGAGVLLRYLNSQASLVNTVGKLDGNFFANNFLMYTVVKDTKRTEKIQFTVTPRTKIEGLDPKIQFVSTGELQQQTGEDIKGIVADNIQTAKTDDVEGDPSLDGTTADAEGSALTQRVPGYRFRYTMRSNSKTYLMEFGENGQIDAEVIKGGNKPHGVISWEDSKVIWYTDIDNAGVVEDGPLYIDGEITNKTDKKFFTRIFTDDEFLEKILNEYEEKYGSSEITGENLRSMLYFHPDGERIFSDESTEVDLSGDSKPSAHELGSVERYGIQ